MGSDGRVVIRAIFDQSNFNTGVGAFRNSMTRLANVARSLGSVIMSAFAVTQIVRFAKEGVDAASRLSDAWLGLQSIVEGQGRSFSKAQSFIQNYISDGLVPLENAVTAYKNLAARGYNDDQIQKVMVALKDAAAFGRQASYSLGDAVTSATEGLKNENSVLVDNAGVTKNVAKMWEDYAQSIGTTANKLTQQQKIQAEVNGILEETRFQTGDAAKAAGTYSGQVASLSYNLQNLKVTIGQALIPILQAILPVINTVIQGLTNLASIFAQVTSALFGTSTASVSSGSEKAAASVSNLADAETDAGEAAKKAEKDMKGVLAGFDELNILADQAADSVEDAAVETPEMEGIQLPEIEGDPELFGNVTVNPEILEFIEKLKEKLQPTIDALKRLWDALKLVGDFVGDNLKNFYDHVLKPIGEWVLGTGLPNLLDALTKLIKNVDWNKLTDALDKFYQKLERFILLNLENLEWIIENFLLPLAEWVLNEGIPIFLEHLGYVLDALCNVIEAAKPYMEWFFTEVLLPLAKWVGGELVPALLDLLAAALNLLAAALKAAQPYLQWFWDNFLKPLAEWTGGVIISVIKELTDLLNDLTSVLNGDMSFSEFVAQLTPVQTAIIALTAALLALKVAMGVFSAIQSIVSTLSALSAAINTVQGLIAGITAVVGGAVLAVTNFFVMWQNGFSWLNEALMVLGTAIAAVGAVILGVPATVAATVAAVVAAIATAVVVIKEHWEDIKQFFISAWGAICDTWNKVADWFDQNVIQPVSDFFSGLCEAIGGFFSSAWDAICNVWKAVSGWFNDNIIKPLTEFFTSVCTTIGDVFKGCWIIIQAVWKAVSSWFNNNVIKPLSQFFTDLCKAIGGFFSGAWTTIKNIWNAVSGWFNSNVIQPVKNFFSGVCTAIGTFFKNAWTTIKNVWNAAGSWFEQHVATPIKNAFQGVQNFVKGIFNGLIGFVEKMINGVIGAINKFLSGFSSVVGWAANFVGVDWSGVTPLPEVKLPRLANGAVIPPNQQFAAILGDQRSGVNVEAPLATIKQALVEALRESGSSTSGTGPIELVVKLDSKVLARGIVPAINNMTISAGRPVLLT